MPRKIDADAWFDRGDAGKFVVHEQTIRTGTDEILTLVLISDPEMLDHGRGPQEPRGELAEGVTRLLLVGRRHRLASLIRSTCYVLHGLAASFIVYGASSRGSASAVGGARVVAPLVVVTPLVGGGLRFGAAAL